MFGFASIMFKDVIRPVTKAKYLCKIRTMLSLSCEHHGTEGSPCK